ncbi:anti-sigma-F factor Fin family protein [Oceanobacillus sp. Castelsardo]|uniref:anti-sigma-F factor Fin family protein n=1 Tax=Oceanobacillus sp. Castelsardo TaxID=1851204 RepID=UPI000838C8D2|nr:anti-sigma-F factor Fin family protein [Oceanobacillus sp. Castelsardo]
MSIVYNCRHCGQNIGKLDNQMIDTSLLGFNQLSEKEKEEMIQYRDNGDVLVIAICESCEETLGRNPHYHELDHFLQ